MSDMGAVIFIKRLLDDLPLPRPATEGSAGFDLHCAELDLVLQPGERHAVKTGIAIAVPRSFEAQVRARSGLALKHGIGLVNGIGTIDSDYRGEVLVLLINHGTEPVEFIYGQRIAQLVVAPVARCIFEQVESLDDTMRGAGGFGHTDEPND